MNMTKLAFITTIALAGLTGFTPVPAQAGGSFGTENNLTFFPAYEFEPLLNTAGTCTLSYSSPSYYYRANGACTRWFSHIELPEGALLTFMYAMGKDNDAALDYSVAIQKSSAVSSNGGNTATYTEYAASVIAPTGNNALERSTYLDLTAAAISIDSYTSSTDLLNDYAVRLDLPSSANLTFRGVLIAWKRQSAPAPASANFSDVPTDHPFFREIENLRASGVTNGCGSGAYCPDAAVTRGQMAAFLSRALGLTQF